MVWSTLKSWRFAPTLAGVFRDPVRLLEAGLWVLSAVWRIA